MKLWKKISLIVISVILVMTSAVIYLIVEIQAGTLRQADEEYVQNTMGILVSNMISVADFSEEDYRDTTVKSLVQYYFSRYASLVQEKNTYYSLASEGEYLYNLCPYDPMARLGEETEGLLRRTVEYGKELVVCRETFSVGQQVFSAYICKDVSATREQIGRLRILGFTLLAAACAVGAVVLALLLRKALEPVARLTRSASLISEGHYGLRTAYESRDEIGWLSKAFDQMAESIEGKIESLDRELERKELLIGALSHEIKTPMTAVVGYADTLLRMPLDKEQQEKCARQIAEAGRRAESLSQKMMDMISLSGQDAAKKQDFAAEKLTGELAEIYGDRVEFICRIESLYGDETLVFSLIENLIQNALRASEEGERIRVTLKEEEGYDVILVEDHGCGISPEHVPLLTEPFYRVDKARSRKMGGAGLGLTICKRIAEWHDGDLHIESAVGVGTTVKVRIAAHTT